MDKKLTAIIPKTRFAVAVRAFPVPRSFVGKISGVNPYSTAYIILDEKLKAHCQPRRAADVRAVVDAYKKTPVRMVETARVPFRPTLGSSTSNPPSKAPGTPRTAIMRELR